MRRIPASLLRALERVDYHTLGFIELMCLNFLPRSPEVNEQRKELCRKHPALNLPIYTPKERRIYDEVLRAGGTSNEALDKIMPMAKARQRRALKRTKVPAAYKGRVSRFTAAAVSR